MDWKTIAVAAVAGTVLTVVFLNFAPSSVPFVQKTPPVKG